MRIILKKLIENPTSNHIWTALFNQVNLFQGWQAAYRIAFRRYERG